jgi:hypothetical protein
MAVDKLKLMVGAPLPCPEIKATITQPTIEDIAFLGEREFFMYLGYLKITKNAFFNTIDNSGFLSDEYKEEVKRAYGTASDFQIVMTICSENPEVAEGIKTILMLLFPGYNLIHIEEPYISLKGSGKPEILIGDSGLTALNKTIDYMFKLNEVDSTEEFRPVNKKAEEIARKIQKRREKVAKEKGLETTKNEHILATFVSNLSVALGLDVCIIKKWTVYQLFTQMKRYNLYTQYDQQVRSAMIGGSEGIEWVDWTKQL